MNKQIMTVAAIATLVLGGVAFAQATPPAGAGANTMGKDKAETGNGSMAGEPDATKTKHVQGKPGSESGAKPTDKMDTDKK
jgi:hypothetical protein